MSTRGLIVLLVGVLAVGFVLVGCGSGGDSASSPSGSTSGGSDSTASLWKAKFIAGADAICKAGGKQAQSEFVAFAKESKIPEGKEPTTAQWEEIGTQVLAPGLQQQVDEIRQLGLPPEDEAQIEAFLDGVENGVEELKKNPAAAKEPSKLLADAHKEIDGYGFKVCGGEK